ncbi:DUF58 domain-containing protein [Spirochaetota bacterium]
MNYNLTAEEEKVLRKLSINVSVKSPQQLQGIHNVSKRGSNIEFREHKQYALGDEMRFIDWKAFSRTDRLYIKTFEEEQSLTIYVILDISSSMFHALHKDAVKKEIVFKTLLYFAYLFRMKKELAGFVTFSSEIDNFRQPKMNFNIPKLFSDIEKNVSNKKKRRTDYQASLKKAHDIVSQGSLVFIISDLYRDPEEIISFLKGFLYKKCKVNLVHTVDMDEYNFDIFKDYYFIDSETDEKLYFNSPVLKKDYRDIFRKHIHDIKQISIEHNIGYFPLFTKMELLKQFSKIFSA